jgi:hypothetical protein
MTEPRKEKEEKPIQGQKGQNNLPENKPKQPHKEDAPNDADPQTQYEDKDES